MVELLGMLLDFLDALAGAVTIAFWWCTWVSPGSQPTRLRTKAHLSEPGEIDRFLLEVRDSPAQGDRAPDDQSRGVLTAGAGEVTPEA
jgi:hypothetical protein